jgi:hypothetical protein
MATELPYTGKEFLDSLDDGREVWIYGERVKNIAQHPAFRNSARMVARLYDALHRDRAEGKAVLSCPTEWGGFTHRNAVFHSPTQANPAWVGQLGRVGEIDQKKSPALRPGFWRILLDAVRHLQHNAPCIVVK